MTRLTDLVAAELEAPVADAVRDFARALAERYGASAEAVLFYGSCLRQQQLEGLMLDFYLLVDDYGRAYGKWWLALANRLIPPNVFYMEHGGLRAKYAVLTTEDFARLAGPGTRNVSVWARFAQPSRLVWARNAKARARVIDAVAQAAPTLLMAARPMLDDQLTVRALWSQAFALTYDAELRSERQGRSICLYDSNPDYYAALIAPALARADLPAQIQRDSVSFTEPADRSAGARAWRRRAFEGKLLSAIRLIKATFTFDGGIDYLAWKIRRHSGVDINIRPWHRRHPIIAGLLLLPMLRRKGAVR